MTGLLAEISPLAVVAAVAFATVLGFVAGWFLGKRDPSRAVLARAERAREIVDDVVRRMEAARADCERLTAKGFETGSVGSPVAADAGRLETSHASLGDAVAKVATGLRTAASRAVAAWTGWDRGRDDPATGLPDAETATANLARLIAAGEGGLLVVSIDGWGRLQRVRGEEVAAHLRAELFRAVVRSGRDDDFVAVIDDRSCGLLFRDAGADGLGPAEAVRTALRRHKFFAGEKGPEVLLTASYGVTPVWPGDTPPAVLARADDAADKSRRRGRNRLHAHDGLKVVGPIEI